MKEIKEKLLEEIEKKTRIHYCLHEPKCKDWENSFFEITYKRFWKIINITIEETSKAKDEEFDKILDELISLSYDYPNWALPLPVIKQIKQRRKEE